MDLQLFVWLVAFAAMIYAGITRYLQRKLVNKKEMDDIQKESKQLGKEYKEATQRKDKAEMEKIMKLQMELLPRMNKVMLGQFKPMVVILLLFLAFTFAINSIDPTKQDDVTIDMNDRGEGCDGTAGDGMYSACYEISGNNYGKWTYTAKAYNGMSEAGMNHTYFFYGKEDSDRYVELGKDAPVALSTDKELYQPGDTVKLYASVPPETATRVTATLDHGTWFYVDLPFTLPLFNVQRIYQPYWWFILISLVLGLTISFILGRIKK